jgi:hypothetical protein
MSSAKRSCGQPDEGAPTSVDSELDADAFAQRNPAHPSEQGRGTGVELHQTQLADIHRGALNQTRHLGQPLRHEHGALRAQLSADILNCGVNTHGQLLTKWLNN